MELSEEICVPCHSGTPPMQREEAEKLIKQIPGWSIEDNKIVRNFEFEDFREAVDFVNRVADIAEAEGHHPDIYISYNKVRLEIWTHKIDGLSKNDFILAAKTDKLL